MLSTMPKDKASLAAGVKCEEVRKESNERRQMMIRRACHEVVPFERRLWFRISGVSVWLQMVISDSPKRCKPASRDSPGLLQCF
jgi:hypothetical protein